VAPRSLKLFPLFLLAALFMVAAIPGPLRAEDLIPVRLVTILTVDDQGLPLRNPYYVFYDRYTGETYSISANGRITVFNKDYFPLVSIGPGRGIRQARGIDVDREGNLYVCQILGPKGPRITVLNAAYFLKKEILMKDIKGTGINMAKFKPTRIRVAVDGRMYILEGGSTAVLVLKADGTFDHWLRAWDELMRPAAKEIANQPAGTIRKNPKAKPGEENPPPYGAVYLSDINLGSEGRVYLVSNETSKVYVFDPREKFLFSFGEKGGAARKMSQPMGVTVDVPRQVIYVIDYMRHTALAYDYYTGRYIFEFGGRGVSPLWFNFPNSISVDKEGNCIVSDTFNQRIQVIDTRMGARRPKLAAIEKKPLLLEPPQAADVSAMAAMSAPARVKAEEPTDTPPARLARPAVPAVAPAGGVIPTLVPLSLAAAEKPVPVSKQQPAPVPARVRAAEPVAKAKRPALRTRPLKVAARRPTPPPAVKIGPVVPVAPMPGPPSGTRLIDLPATLGVYGPVAVIGVIATWFILKGK